MIIALLILALQIRVIRVIRVIRALSISKEAYDTPSFCFLSLAGLLMGD